MSEEDVRIRLAPNWAHPCGTRVWIGDHELRGVKTVQIEHTAGEARLLKITMFANLEVTTERLADDVDWPDSPVVVGSQDSNRRWAKPASHVAKPFDGD